MFGGDSTRDTAIAWAFVVGQFGLLIALVISPTRNDFELPAATETVGSAVQLVGAAFLLIGFINLGRSLTPLPVPVPHGELRTGGIYRLVRHPIYTGLIFLAAGLLPSRNSVVSLALALALTAWLMAKARWEERKLRDRYVDYAAYCARTPRFVPFWPFGADRAG